MLDHRQEARALRDTGRSVDEVADHFGVNRATVYRWLAQERDGTGPNERAAQSLVAKWGDLDEERAVLAESLVTLAVIADRGRAATVGVLAAAGVQAVKELRIMLAELGQENGFEDLRRALMDE